MRLLLWAPADVPVADTLCCRTEVTDVLSLSPGVLPVADLDVQLSLEEDLSDEDVEIGTRGGISLGAGARNPLLGESLLVVLLAGDAPSSRLSWLELLRPLLSSVAGDFPSGDDDFLWSLSLPESFFSMGGMIDFEGDVSLPILLHVWASNARGDFLASNWKKKNTAQVNLVNN